MLLWLEKHMLPCLYKSIFGIDCPGCGFQRSCIALLKGDLIKSLSLYPATIPIFITAGFFIVNTVFKFKKQNAIKKGLLGIVGVIVVVNYLLNMFNKFIC